MSRFSHVTQTYVFLDGICLRCSLQVELDSQSGVKRKKGKVNTESNGDASTKRCGAGSSVKKNLEENEPEAIGESDAAGMDWEEGHVSVVDCKEGYSHDLGETVTVEFTDVPSSAEKKSVRRHTAEEKVNISRLKNMLLIKVFAWLVHKHASNLYRTVFRELVTVTLHCVLTRQDW
jgi:hypothetical protein